MSEKKTQDAKSWKEALNLLQKQSGVPKINPPASSRPHQNYLQAFSIFVALENAKINFPEYVKQ